MKDMFDLCPHAALPTPGDARLAKPISKPHLHLPASYIGLNCRSGSVRFGRLFGCLKGRRDNNAYFADRVNIYHHTDIAKLEYTN